MTGSTAASPPEPHAPPGTSAPPGAAAPPHRRPRAEGILTTGAVVLSLIGLIGIGAVLIQAAAGDTPSAVMTFTGMICLPIGFALMMILFVLTAARRRRT